jgi:hypothetical protein
MNRATDSIGTPVFPGTIIAYPTHKGSSSAKLNFALVERVAEETFGWNNESTRFNLFVVRIDGGKRTKVQNSRTGIVVHPFHYTNEMRDLVWAFEDAHPEIARRSFLKAADIVVNGENLPDRITSGTLALGTLERKDEDQAFQEMALTTSITSSDFEKNETGWKLNPAVNPPEFNQGILIGGELQDPQVRALTSISKESRYRGHDSAYTISDE